MDNEGTVHVTAELSADDFQALKALANARGVDANTVLRSAISTEKLIADNVSPGDQLLIKRGNEYSKVVFKK